MTLGGEPNQIERFAAEGNENSRWCDVRKIIDQFRLCLILVPAGFAAFPAPMPKIVLLTQFDSSPFAASPTDRPPDLASKR